MRGRLESESGQRIEFETKITQYETQLREVNNITRKIAEYENKIAIINEERERLESALKVKTNELNERDRVARDLEFEVESSRRKMTNMEGRLGEFNTMTEKIMQYELSINRMKSQFSNFERERLEFEDVRRESELLKKKVSELGEASTRANEFEFKI
jgi:chromosome segregation ATPase